MARHGVLLVNVGTPASPSAAAKYRAIWSPSGSPLLARGIALRSALAARLGGERLELVESLNSGPAWVEAPADLAADPGSTAAAQPSATGAV